MTFKKCRKNAEFAECRKSRERDHIFVQLNMWKKNEAFREILFCKNFYSLQKLVFKN